MRKFPIKVRSLTHLITPYFSYILPIFLWAEYGYQPIFYQVKNHSPNLLNMGGLDASSKYGLILRALSSPKQQSTNSRLSMKTKRKNLEFQALLHEDTKPKY